MKTMSKWHRTRVNRPKTLRDHHYVHHLLMSPQSAGDEVFRMCLSSICPSSEFSEVFLENAFCFTNFVADNVNFKTRLSIVSRDKTAASFSREALRSFIRTATSTFKSTK